MIYVTLVQAIRNSLKMVSLIHECKKLLDSPKGVLLITAEDIPPDVQFIILEEADI